MMLERLSATLLDVDDFLQIAQTEFIICRKWSSPDVHGSGAVICPRFVNQRYLVFKNINNSHTHVYKINTN